MAECSPGLARQLRAIGPLPATAAGVVPTLLCLIWGTQVGWGLPGVAMAAPALAGTALIAIGLRLMHETISLFARRGKGTLAPWDPTRKLVVEGPYRRVRNPMISGVFTVLLGEAALLGSPAVLVWSGAFALVNAIFIPLAEEPDLIKRFGDDYLTYKRNVPRWIPRRHPWTPVFVLALASAILVSAPAAATETPAAAATSAVVSHTLTQTPAEVRDYWTPERMREAAPLELPHAGAAAATSSGSPTLYSQLPDLETDPALDTAYPQRLHGKLLISFGAQNGSCSATVVTSRARNLLLTAGHCVVQPGGEGVEPVWATNVLFVPSYRNAAMPFGSYAATALRAPLHWTFEPDFALDAGAVNLAPGAGGQISDQLGSRGVSFNRARYKKNKTRFQIFGYPAQPSAFYDAERLILCDSPFNGFQKGTGSLNAGPCNMKEGSSGGGWVIKGGLLNSVVSHSGCPISVTNCTLTSGTPFGDIIFKLWKAAGGGIAKGRQKRVNACKQQQGEKRARCFMKAETFKPVGGP